MRESELFGPGVTMPENCVAKVEWSGEIDIWDNKRAAACVPGSNRAKMTQC
jgi:hypothetical protein